MSQYKATHNSPYHLSVGVVVMTKERKVVCHKVNNGDIKDGYNLVRSSLKDNETPNEAVTRAIMEELGSKGEILAYLGSTVTKDEWWHEINDPKEVEKTTIYFLVQETNRSKRKDWKGSVEGISEIVEVETDFLLTQMPKQAKEVGWSDLDESQIILRARDCLATSASPQSEQA